MVNKPSKSHRAILYVLIVIGVIGVVVWAMFSYAIYKDIRRIQLEDRYAQPTFDLQSAEKEYLAAFIKIRNPRAKQVEEIVKVIYEGAELYDLNPLLIAARIEVESNFRSGVTGKAGERGLMQISKIAAKEIHANWDAMYTIHGNIMAGCAYLRLMIARHGEETASARYNGVGPSAEVYRKKIDDVGAEYFKI